MIIDNFQLFTGTSNGATGGITASSYADSPTTGTQAASNIIDYGIVSGIPSGGAAPNSANRDMGIGDDPALKLACVVTIAMTGGTSIGLQLQGAPDNASGASGTYYTLWTGPVILVANLVAGANLANVDIPREIPLIGPTRYLKLNFITAGTFSAGAIEAWVALDQFQQIIGPSATSPLSGYPAGFTVAN